MTYVEMFKTMVLDEVATRVAIEQQAGCPQGLVNKAFETITGDLIMADWVSLSKHRAEDVIRAICYGGHKSHLGNIIMPEGSI